MNDSAQPLATLAVDLPRPDLSAREALGLIRAHALDAHPAWEGCMLFSEGAADKNGRLTANVGGWLVAYRAAAEPEVVRATLYCWGKLVFRQSAAWVKHGPMFPLDSEWIDSTAAAEIIAREPLIHGMDANNSLSLSLRVVQDIGLFWGVTRHFRDTSTQIATNHSFGIDARRGDIAVETLERIDQRGMRQRSRRDRLNGTGWQDC